VIPRRCANERALNIDTRELRPLCLEFDAREWSRLQVVSESLGTDYPNDS
jgi:hypothetical protein